MKQTAVDWLITQLKEMEYDIRLIPNTIKIAKAMEKEQIEDAFKHGKLPTLFADNLTAKEYYNETYNK